MIRLVLGLLTAALYVVWLWIMGVDLLTTWAILTVVLTFVPNLGSIISGTLPVIYAVLTRDLGTALAVGAGLFAIEQIVGNYIDPIIAGREVAVSPLVVLVSLLVWTFVLGPVGALLATPATIAIMIVCARIDPLRPFALMLSDCEDWSAFDRATGVAARA
jgi:AI-2 transport protein TqsA